MFALGGQAQALARLSTHSYICVMLANLPARRQRVWKRASPHVRYKRRFAIALRLPSSGGPGIGLAVRNIKAANPGRSGPSRRSAAGSNACNQVGIRPHTLVA